MSDNTGPAFPAHVKQGSLMILDGGLTKREYMAIAAMQGLLANPNVAELTKGQKSDGPARDVATSAFNIADAMIKAGEE